MKTLEKAIADGWGWKIAAPVAVIDSNSFGNVIVFDSLGKYYRIIPEDLGCVFLTEDEEELTEITLSEDFQIDWHLLSLTRDSEIAHGPLEVGQCYHLVAPSLLGGAYSVDNIRKISIIEWLECSGSLAKQIDGLPDGARIIIKTTRD